MLSDTQSAIRNTPGARGILFPGTWLYTGGGDGVEAVYNDVKYLIATATATHLALKEKNRAFDQIVRQYQDLAYGYAYAVLGEFELAEDAAQEAFIAAWRSLNQLREPAAFPGWLKRIVLTQCSRLTRGKQLELVPLEAAAALPSTEPDPYHAAEQSALRERVSAEVQALPEKRPSRNGRFAETVALYNEALESLVAKLKQDRYVLAAILYGSLSHDQVWEKSDIDLMIVGREEKKAGK